MPLLAPLLGKSFSNPKILYLINSLYQNPHSASGTTLIPPRQCSSRYASAAITKMASR